MNNFPTRKLIFIAAGIFALLSLLILLPSKQWSTKISSLIQALAIVTLVAVTWFYAIQTKEQVIRTTELISEQRMQRDLQFSERRLHKFYNPFIHALDEAKEKFSERSIAQNAESLNPVRVNLFFPYSYMLSENSLKIVHEFFVLLGMASVQEANKDLPDKGKEGMFNSLSEMRDILHKERTIIEDFISKNYLFPEKESH
jgi:4-amino-4-deoxy-L-arabinose transferase-like glycosyltransferase